MILLEIFYCGVAAPFLWFSILNCITLSFSRNSKIFKLVHPGERGSHPGEPGSTLVSRIPAWWAVLPLLLQRFRKHVNIPFNIKKSILVYTHQWANCTKEECKKNAEHFFYVSWSVFYPNKQFFLGGGGRFCFWNSWPRVEDILR